MSEGRILIVEDDEDLSHMLEYNLTKKGYSAITALDGLAACQLIEETKPDLILLDIMLPGLNGWEICEIIRSHEHEQISEIPIIMLTALSSLEDKLKGIEIGADDYIPKPFAIKEVLLKADRLISKEKRKKQLNSEVRKLETREKQQTDFQTMLFHELKNQLFIIGGYSSIIAAYSSQIKERRFLPPEKYRRCAGIIKDTAKSLVSLAEEILFLSRLETGEYPLPLEEVCLEEIAQDVISVLGQQAKEKEMRINFEMIEKIPKMRLNMTALKLSLSNLIENAVKYSPKRSDIKVSLQPQGEVAVMVQVKDSGPGIPEKDMGKIFDKFYKGENVKNKTKGTGIGLYVAKTLIEAMGGVIGVETEDENGSCFRVVFKKAKERTGR